MCIINQDTKFQRDSFHYLPYEILSSYLCLTPPFTLTADNHHLSVSIVIRSWKMGTENQDKAVLEEESTLREAASTSDNMDVTEKKLKTENNGASLTGRKILSSNQNEMESRIEVEANTCPPVFKLFPEIWDSIFPYLKPKDFESIINSSPVFRTLFESERTERLLPLWLPVFLKKVGIREVSALLRWRGVNKTAKSIVDNLLEESSSPQTYHEIDSINSPRWTPVVGNGEDELRLVVEKIKTCYKFRKSIEIQQFLAHMNSAPSVALANPFLTRSLVLEVGGSVVVHPGNMLPNHLIMSMVEKYGDLISSLSFNLDSGLDVNFLFPILSQLPNLKVLVLDAFVTPSSEEDIARWLPQVQLNQLELLDVRNASEDENGSMMTPLLRCIGPQLQRLLCEGDIVDAHLEALRRGAFPNLCSILVEFVNWQYLNELSNLDISPPLQEIELADANGDVSVADVYQGIRSFADTLVHLALFLPLYIHIDIDLLEFPNLSKFSTTLGNVHEDWFHDFIQLQAQRLTELNFHYGGSEESREPPGPQLIAELRQIFEDVPNLKAINIFCSFNLIVGDYTAEKIVIERSGLRRFQFKRGLAA